MNEKIYPHIENIQPSAPFEEEVLASIKKSRLHEFTLEKKKLEDLLIHY